MTATQIPNVAAFVDDNDDDNPDGRPARRQQTAYLIRADLVIEAHSSAAALLVLLHVLDDPAVARILELAVDDAVPGILST